MRMHDKVLELPIGNYTVEVSANGFKQTKTVSQALNINQSLLINVQLSLGETTQTVEVTGAAAQVETQSPTVGTLVTGAPIENLPLNGRNTLSLAITMPGVVPTPGAGNTAGSGSFSIAGGELIRCFTCWMVASTIR